MLIFVQQQRLDELGRDVFKRCPQSILLIGRERESQESSIAVEHRS